MLQDYYIKHKIIIKYGAVASILGDLWTKKYSRIYISTYYEADLAAYFELVMKLFYANIILELRWDWFYVIIYTPNSRINQSNQFLIYSKFLFCISLLCYDGSLSR